jgi:hypothetical protein
VNIVQSTRQQHQLLSAVQLLGMMGSDVIELSLDRYQKTAGSKEWSNGSKQKPSSQGLNILSSEISVALRGTDE